MSERENGPLYARVAERLRGEIVGKVYGPGERLLPVHQLCSRYGVSLLTMRRALDILARWGMIERSRGRGTFVSASFGAGDRRTVGILLPRLELSLARLTATESPTQFLASSGALAACQALGWEARFLTLKSFWEKPDAVRDFGGLIVIYPNREDEELLERTSRLSLPVVCVNLLMDAWRDRLWSVNCDYVGAGRDMMDYLAKAGAKKPAFLTTLPPREDYHSWWLRRGFAARAIELGTPVQWLPARRVDTRYQRDAAKVREAIELGLAETTPFDGVAVTGVTEARQLRETLREQGRKSDDYALVSWLFRAPGAPAEKLSGFEAPLWEMGKTAMETLVAIVKGEAPASWETNLAAIAVSEHNG